MRQFAFSIEKPASAAPSSAASVDPDSTRLVRPAGSVREGRHGRGGGEGGHPQENRVDGDLRVISYGRRRLRDGGIRIARHRTACGTGSRSHRDGID